MKNPETNKLILVNVVLWIVAMLLHPLIQMLPTASGKPPKIFELLIPLFFIMLAGASTYLLKSALEQSSGD